MESLELYLKTKGIVTAQKLIIKDKEGREHLRYTDLVKLFRNFLRLDNPKGDMTVQTAIELVSSHYDVTLLQIQNKGRRHSIVLARQALMYYLYEHCLLSLQEVATIVNRLSHVTVMHGVRQHKRRMLE